MLGLLQLFLGLGGLEEWNVGCGVIEGSGVSGKEVSLTFRTIFL